MDPVCLVFAILPGKTADARAFMRDLDGPRKAEFDQSERRIGITKELWYLASAPGGDQLVGYMEAASFGQAVAQFSASQDPFDRWFKQRMADVTGVDLNNIPAGFAPPELLSHYDVTHVQNT
jgi:hypothetical protein